MPEEWRWWGCRVWGRDHPEVQIAGNDLFGRHNMNEAWATYGLLGDKMG